MDTLATIAVEIQATLTGVLVVALVTILEILDLRRAKHFHRQKMQELSEFLTSPGYESIRPKKKYCLISTFSLILQIIFGIIVFVTFSCWALYLIKADYAGSAIFSAVTAIVGILMPLAVWLSCKQKSKEMAHLINKIESRPVISTEKGKSPAPAAQFSPVAGAEIKEIKPEPIAVAQTVAEAQPITKPAPVVAKAPEPAAQEVPSATVYEKTDFSAKIPEDSMLRRHYLTHIQNKRQLGLPARPTDSILRRHYDSLMASLQKPVSKHEPAPIRQAVPLKTAAIVDRAIGPGNNVQGLPQDSILRRHYLATLSYRLESGLPPRPTDSILMRHFDSWKNYLIECEINKRLCGS